MGIYISGVKGLPEQVQENKNKIKEVEEQIEGIDFEAVRQLQGQVAENTQDINNLEASIGVQNQAINSLNDDVDALESKTQKITYNEQSGELTIDANVNVKRINITAAQTPLTADSMVSRDDKNAISLTGANGELSLIVGRTGTQHILNFNTDGTIDIDGQPVGAKPLYMHDIYINIKDTANFTNYFLMLKIINDSSEAFTFDTLKAYIADGTIIQVSGGAVDNNNIYKLPIYLARDTSNYRIYSLSLDTNYLSQSILNSSPTTFLDTIRQIA